MSRSLSTRIVTLVATRCRAKLLILSASVDVKKAQMFDQTALQTLKSNPANSCVMGIISMCVKCD